MVTLRAKSYTSVIPRANLMPHVCAAQKSHDDPPHHRRRDNPHRVVHHHRMANVPRSGTPRPIPPVTTVTTPMIIAALAGSALTAALGAALLKDRY